MTTKPLLLAIIAALPFSAMADYTYITEGPAPVQNNGTARIIDYNGPYVDATINDDDDEHIASTAYVKGAYNDTIAAINFLSDRKMPNMSSGDNGLTIDTDTLGADRFVEQLAGDMDIEEFGHLIVSAYGVATGIKSQRVKIYTTWDDDRDSATTQVALETVVPED